MIAVPFTFNEVLLVEGRVNTVGSFVELDEEDGCVETRRGRRHVARVARVLYGGRGGFTGYHSNWRSFSDHRCRVPLSMSLRRLFLRFGDILRS